MRLHLSVIVALGVAVLFFRLGEQPLVMWDEARLAANAAEMLESGDPIVTRYAGAPDLWNTKPPLVVWAQALSLTVFSDPEFAVRFPSALAGLATLVLVYFFLRRVGDAFGGLVAALVLLGSSGFLFWHGARNGDYDAPLVLWTTLYATSWFLYLREGRTAALALFAGGLALAILTKGIAGTLLLPGLLVFTVLSGRIGGVAADVRAWAAFGAALALPMLWYAVREAAGPGYIDAVIANETGRYAVPIEGNTGGMFYYLDELASGRFVPWVYLLVPAALLACRRSRALTLWAGTTVLAFFAVIETSGTKLPWYDLPAYPLMAIVLGTAASAVLSLPRWQTRTRPSWPVLPRPFTLVIVTLVAVPIVVTAYTVHTVDWGRDPRLNYGRAIDAWQGVASTVLDGGVGNGAGLANYNAVLRFHATLARLRGITLAIVHPGHDFAAGERFFTCDPEALAWATDRFALAFEAGDGACAVARVEGVRQVSRFWGAETL